MNKKANLRPFCPTRWTVRYESLHSIYENYNTLREFFRDYSSSDTSDAAAKANGFLKNIDSFDFFFTISLLQKVFGHLDATNTAIQKKQFHFGNVKLLIQTLHDTIKSFRNQFEEFWKVVNEKKIIFEIDSPKLKRKKKIPKKFDASQDNLKDYYTNVENKYKRLYYEIIDNIVNCLERRFDTEVSF